MIKIILFELTRILLGYASDKVGEFIRNKQRNGSRPPSFYEEEEEDPWSQHPLRRFHDPRPAAAGYLQPHRPTMRYAFQDDMLSEEGFKRMS